MFTCENISVELQGDKGTFLAVDEASVCVKPHEIVDIVGPSGAGKSTFLHALALLLPLASGAIALNDEAFGSMTPQEWRARVALVQQKPALLEGTIERNLLVPWTLKIHKNQPQPARKDLEALMSNAGLGDIALDRDVSQLSVGQQARVAFMRTLLTRPDVLLLDEVDAALDAASTHVIGELTSDFATAGGMVLRVRHKLDDKRAAKRLVFSAGRAQCENVTRGEHNE